MGGACLFHLVLAARWGCSVCPGAASHLASGSNCSTHFLFLPTLECHLQPYLPARHHYGYTDLVGRLYPISLGCDAHVEVGHLDRLAIRLGSVH
jgi:hypothetical protein